MQTGRKIMINVYDFLNSKIYDKRVKAYRAFYSKNEKGSIYPEITAYAINLCCILHEKLKDKFYLARAKECAKYLINLVKKYENMIPFNGKKYTFDTGIFISALVDLYKISKNSLYIKQAKKSLKALLDYWDGEKFLPGDNIDESDWPEFYSVHLVKLAIPLLKMKKYKIAKKLLKWGMKLQGKNGEFIINEKNEKVLLHPHCYATEGFLFAYSITKDRKYLRIAKKASRWLINRQNYDGSVNIGYPSILPIKAFDATAQAIRIWKVLGINKKIIEKSESFLNKNVNDNGLPLTKHLLFWKNKKRVYSWPTFFFIHSKFLKYNNLEEAKYLF